MQANLQNYVLLVKSSRLLEKPRALLFTFVIYFLFYEVELSSVGCMLSNKMTQMQLRGNLVMPWTICVLAKAEVVKLFCRGIWPLACLPCYAVNSYASSTVE